MKNIRKEHIEKETGNEVGEKMKLVEKELLKLKTKQMGNTEIRPQWRENW